MGTETSRGPGPGTHCEWCGAPYEPGAEPPPPRPAPPAPIAESSPTHCEWCGAEYPEPRQGGAGVSPPG